MAFIDWQDAYSVGSHEFDDEHKTFIAILNRCFEATINDQAALDRLLGELSNYAATHFRHEEELLAQHGHPDLDTHRRQHQSFIDKIAQARGRADEPEQAASELVDFLQDWLLNHILESDMKYRTLFEQREGAAGGLSFSNVSIGKRLFIGSGVFAVVLAAAVGLTLLAVRNLDSFIGQVMERQLPSTVGAMAIVNDVNGSLATLRGWMLTGDATFKSDRAALWRGIDTQAAALDRARDGWTDPAAKAQWEEARQVLSEFRTTQDRVEAVAHTPEEQPALRLLEEQATPLVRAMFTDITAMIDDEKTREATPERKALLADMADFRGTVSMAAANLRGYLLSGTDAAWGDFSALWQRNQAAFDRLTKSKALLAPAQADAFARISEARAAYAALPGKLKEIRQSPRWNEALFLLKTEAAPRAERLLALLSGERGPDGGRSGGFVERQRAGMDTGARAIADGTASLMRNQWLILIGGLVLTTGFALLMIHSIVPPIRDIVGTMKRLAAGDHEVEIAALGRRDEIGAMADAVQVFKENAVQNVRLRAAQEALIRRTKEEGRRTLTRIADGFEASVMGVVGQVASAAGDMRGSADDMTHAADESSQLAQSAQSAAQQAAHNVETVAAATEELRASIHEISRQVSDSARVAQEAVAEADRTNDIVGGLSEAADKIGEVLGLISDIASQTNLLALNATIEAARAGDAGKGFAVVANEVKHLANQTAKATDDIGTQIAGVQSSTREAVEAIRRISAVIGQVSSISAAIAAAVEEQGAATGEIARNVDQAAGGTRQVSDNMDGVTRTVVTTRAAADQVLTAATALSGQADMLRSEVERFIARIRAG